MEADFLTSATILRNGYFDTDAASVAEKIASLIKKSVPDYLIGEWRLANTLAGMPVLDAVVERPDRKRNTDTSRRRHRSRRSAGMGVKKGTLLRLKNVKRVSIPRRNTGRRSFVRRCFQLIVTCFQFIPVLMRFGIFVEVQVQLQQTIRASEVTLTQAVP